MSDRVQSVERSIDILMVLGQGPRSLTQISVATGLSKGTTHRLLSSLNYQSVVLKHPSDNVYLLGPGVLRLVQEAMQGIGSFAILARPAMAELRDATNETITLHVRVGLERIVVEQLPSPQPLRYTASVGSVAPLHVGSAGKTLLAFDDEDEIDRTLEELRLEAITPATIVNPHALREELAEVRARGWATSFGERVPDAAAVSVPVFANSRLVAVMSVLAPASRLGVDRQQEVLPDLRRAAIAFQAVLEAASPASANGDRTPLAPRST
jgi:IclR family acetate operon transcriptional repressor